MNYSGETTTGFEQKQSTLRLAAIEK